MTTSLEGRGIATGDVLAGGLLDTAAKFQQQLANESPTLSDIDPEAFGSLSSACFNACADRVRRTPVFNSSGRKGQIKWLSRLVCRRRNAAPRARVSGARCPKMLAPIPAGFRDNRPHFGNVSRDIASNPIRIGCIVRSWVDVWSTLRLATFTCCSLSVWSRMTGCKQRPEMEMMTTVPGLTFWRLNTLRLARVWFIWSVPSVIVGMQRCGEC